MITIGKARILVLLAVMCVTGPLADLFAAPAAPIGIA